MTDFVRLQQLDIQKREANEQMRWHAEETRVELYLRTQELDEAKLQGFVTPGAGRLGLIPRANLYSLLMQAPAAVCCLPADARRRGDNRGSRSVRLRHHGTSATCRTTQRSRSRERRVIAIISHELRTPMTSILGWARMLALGGLDKETEREALESIERSTRAQAKLIEDLLDESRIASGKLRLELRPLDLAAVIEGAAEAKRIRISIHVHPDTYPMAGDPVRLQQVIGNVSNECRPGEQARIIAAGFQVFRQKPIDPGDLAYEVARLASRDAGASTTG